MNTVFQCPQCQLQFEAQGYKDEWLDPTFGHCWRYVADCPQCGKSSPEYKQPKAKSKNCNSGSCESCSGCNCG